MSTAAASGTWSWPDEVTQSQVDEQVKEELKDELPLPGSFESENIPHEGARHRFAPNPDIPIPKEEDVKHENPTNGASQPNSDKKKTYGPRTCRICLEVVLPSYEPPPAGITASFTPAPKVQYISEDPESGRLIRPCKCKGSQSYVHEGCLQAWRMADPANKRNYFECPTCKYPYRLSRMKWATWVGSKATAVALTIVVFCLAVFLLGFLADPIMNLYLDFWGTIFMPWTWFEPAIYVGERGSMLSSVWWIVHLSKGFTGLALLGAAKASMSMGALNWFGVRTLNGVRVGGRRQRDNRAEIGLVMLVVGISTALYGIWRLVNMWCRAKLETASENVLDVHGEEDEDEDDSANTADAREAKKEQ